MYLEHTPIEKYQVKGRTVFVKRDDLFAMPPAPPLAKLRGIRMVLQREITFGTKVVGCYQTRVSNVGHALAAACRELGGLQCVVVYPQSKVGPIPDSAERARCLGAILRPIPSNVLPICYRQAKRILEEMQGTLLPFGMECQEAVEAIEREAATTPLSVCENGTVIVPCGSGVTLSGIIRGLPGHPSMFIGVSSGRSVKKIRTCIAKHANVSAPLCVLDPLMPYHTKASVDCPFPADPFYDLKAWQFLLKELENLSPPILFWNVGG